VGNRFLEQNVAESRGENLVHSVGDSVAGVQLDGGESGLTGGRGGNGFSGKSSITYSGKGGIGAGHGGGRGNVGNNVSGGGGKKSSTIGIGSKSSSIGIGSKSSSIGIGEDGLTLLSLLGSSSGSSSSSVNSSQVLGSGSSDLSGLLDRGRSLKSDDSGGKGSSGKVGSRHSEAVEGVGDVVDGLEETIGINVLVGSLGHSVGSAGFSSGGWATGMTERELSEFVLGMELVGLAWVDGPGGVNKHLTGASTHASCQNNQSVHDEFQT